MEILRRLLRWVLGIPDHLWSEAEVSARIYWHGIFNEYQLRVYYIPDQARNAARAYMRAAWRRRARYALCAIVFLSLCHLFTMLLDYLVVRGMS